MYNFYINEKASNAEKTLQKNKLDAKRKQKRENSKSILKLLMLNLIKPFLIFIFYQQTALNNQRIIKYKERVANYVKDVSFHLFPLSNYFYGIQ